MTAQQTVQLVHQYEYCMIKMDAKVGIALSAKALLCHLEYIQRVQCLTSCQAGLAMVFTILLLTTCPQNMNANGLSRIYDPKNPQTLLPARSHTSHPGTSISSW